ncbi:MAG: MlaE family lipid ABC transporter permease subunit [Phormidium sp.]
MTPKQLINPKSRSKTEKIPAKDRVNKCISHTTESPKKSGADELKWEKSYQNGWGKRLLVTILLVGQVFLRILKGKICRRHLVEQMAIVGFGSLNSVLLIAFFAGIIFTIQTAREMMRFGAVHLVGGAFALAFCRELAPILTAGIVAGQVGSAFAAEIGEMQVTEQIDALYMLRTNPIDYLVVPRVVACCIMLPVLTIFALVIGIFGGVLVATYFYNLPAAIFLNSVRDFLELSDLFAVVIKAFIFGGIVAVISCGWGLTTKGGSKGVSRSTTGAVVTSWVGIFMIDFLLSLAIFQEVSLK